MTRLCPACDLRCAGRTTSPVGPSPGAGALRLSLTGAVTSRSDSTVAERRPGIFNTDAGI